MCKQQTLLKSEPLKNSFLSNMQQVPTNGISTGRLERRREARPGHLRQCQGEEVDYGPERRRSDALGDGHDCGTGESIVNRADGKLGNVWVWVQLIFGPPWPMNQLKKNPNI